MLNDIQFGQYYPVKSFIHNMDARAKILLLIAYIVMVFLVKVFIGYTVALLFVLTVTLLAKVPILTVLKSIKGIMFIIIFTFIINIFFYIPTEESHVIFWKITTEGVLHACFFSSRLILLVLGSSLLTLTTTPVNLTDGIESLLNPLKKLAFPVHELALIMSIALRFIPTLMDETQRIINAQKARGADFESGNLINRSKALVPILIPLLISSFRRAEELGDAMDARCYSGSKGRTKFKQLKFTYRDLLATITVAICITAVALLNIYSPIILGAIGL